MNNADTKISLPKDVKKQCNKLLSIIYNTFPGEDAPDLLKYIELLAEKAFVSGYNKAISEKGNEGK